MNVRPRIVILGAGNVATHLVLALADKADLVQIYNRRIENAVTLASKVGACATDSLSELDKEADLYIISINDDGIPQIAEKLKGINDKVWVHTSGSTPAYVLKGIGGAYGVLYPLQTFSKESYVNMAEVPIFIEASDNSAKQIILQTAQLISDHVHYADSGRRRILHMAAVFACNFANFMWTQSDSILKKEGLDISVFQPLITATLEKAISISPEKGQTGPARRGDIEIIRCHEAMLSGESARLYEILSEAIFNHYHQSTEKQ